jgi:predicted dehydrogenase
MKSKLLLLLVLGTCSIHAQQPRLAIVGLNHDHVWNELNPVLKGDLVTLVGVSETLPGRVRRIETEETTAQGGVRPAVPASLVFPDWKKMIDQTKPSIVWAYVETSRHLEIVQYCAPRGINVMFEYPLSVTVQDAHEIRKLAQQYGIRVLTNYQFWAWTAPTYAAKAAVDAGEIGPVYRLSGLLGHGGPGDYRGSTFLTWLMTEDKNGGGALVDFGAPTIAWAIWIKGVPESVYARVDHLRPYEFNGMDDNSTIIMNYKNAVAIIEGTWDMTAAPVASNQIFGLEGGLVIGRDGVDLYTRGPKPAGGTGRGPLIQTPLVVPPLSREFSGALAYMVDRIHKSLPISGMCSLEVNVPVVEVLEASRKSISDRTAVEIH